MKFRYMVIISLLLVSIVSSMAAFAPTRRVEAFGDPIGNYNFRVEIDGVDAGSFSAVDGLERITEVVEYKVGDEMLVRKRPGTTKFSNIVLKKGYMATTILDDWHESLRQGDYTRKSISIVLLHNAPNGGGGDEIKRWNLFEAFPVRWKMSPMDGMGNEALTEEIEIAFEYFEEA